MPHIRNLRPHQARLLNGCLIPLGTKKESSVMLLKICEQCKIERIGVAKRALYKTLTLDGYDQMITDLTVPIE